MNVFNSGEARRELCSLGSAPAMKQISEPHKSVPSCDCVLLPLKMFSPSFTAKSDSTCFSFSHVS